MENTIIVGVKAVILNNGRALIIKRAKSEKIGGGTWEPVGGILEFGEDIEVALRREIKEEVGFTVTINKILYASTFKTDPSRQVVILTYLCETENTNVSLSDEHEEFIWATKEDLKQLLPLNILEDFEKNKVFSLKGLI